MRTRKIKLKVKGEVIPLRGSTAHIVAVQPEFDCYIVRPKGKKYNLTVPIEEIHPELIAAQ